MSLRRQDAPKVGAARFTWPVRVYYEDTDATGVVYHARYLHFFERARTEWLREMRLSQQELRDREAVVFTVAGIEIRFLQPARLEDDLAVDVTVPEVRRASLVFHQALRRASDGIVLSTARVRVGCVEVARFRPCPLPEDFFNAMHQWSSS